MLPLTMAVLVLAAAACAADGTYHTVLTKAPRAAPLHLVLQHFTIPPRQCSGQITAQQYAAGCARVGGLSAEVEDGVPFPDVSFDEKLSKVVVYRATDITGSCPGRAVMTLRVSCPGLTPSRRAPMDLPPADTPLPY